MCGPEDPLFTPLLLFARAHFKQKSQFTSPQIGKFLVHKPPFSAADIDSQAPLFGNPGRTLLPKEKLSAPLGFTSVIQSLRFTNDYKFGISVSTYQ